MSPQERRRFARTLSRIADASVSDVLDMAQAVGAVRCRRIGITGPPGAGKSTLIARLARHRLRGDGDLAIIAIDPSSPVSGGAILGDRIRMEELATEPRIYIRSLATRASLDGLADNLPDILASCDCFGFAEVLVETVGVGQVAYAIGALVDTMVLVLPPGAGDQVQAMKSGILEKADICVVNKADQQGAEQLAADLRAIVKHRTVPANGWEPPVVSVSIADPNGVAELAAEIDRHQASAAHTGRAAIWQAHHVRSLLARRVGEVLGALPDEVLQQPVDRLYRKVVQQLIQSDATPPGGRRA